MHESKSHSQSSLPIDSHWGDGELMLSDVLQNFSPKIVFSMDAIDFTIKTAETVKEIQQALKLRHQIFLQEGLGKHHSTGLEFDALDQLADHLLIIEKSSGAAIGTCRLIHSKFSPTFFCEKQFQLAHFLSLEGAKLELGRACTHKDHRTGRTMDLLWRGLSKYIILSKTRYLFGCSSVKSIVPEFVFSVLKSLEAMDSVGFDFEIMPTDAHRYIDAANHFGSAKASKTIMRSLPPLLRSYLHAGAKVHGFPSLDSDFESSGLLTVLDLRNLKKKFQDHYLLGYKI